ncbi:hypothetical protein AKO1_000144 [Acrasis kona]|uniref:RGS domain-containing protein n=1 Tax=Acrasis kona TaxID=1008807 RepID=A0AAW2ZEX8_9EUKA
MCNENLRRKRSNNFVVDEKSPIYWRFQEEIEPCNFDQSNEPMLRLILSNDTLHSLFKEHARQEYSDESVLLWECIQRYRSKQDRDTRQEISHYIFNTFLSPESVSSVNVNQHIVDLVWSRIDSCEFTDDTFNELEKEVEENLSDIHSRFITTPEYIEYMGLFKKKNRRTRSFSLPIITAIFDDDSLKKSERKSSFMNWVRKLSPRSTSTSPRTPLSPSSPLCK